MVQCFAYAVREVNVGRADEHASVLVRDVHDPLKRMLSLFLLFHVADELDYLRAMPCEKLPIELHVAGRKMILDTVACGTHLAMRRFWLRPPLPSTIGKQRAALRTHGGRR